MITRDPNEYSTAHILKHLDQDKLDPNEQKLTDSYKLLSDVQKNWGYLPLSLYRAKEILEDEWACKHRNEIKNNAYCRNNWTTNEGTEG